MSGLSRLKITVPDGKPQLATVTLNGEPVTATRVAFVVDVKQPMVVRLDIIADVEVGGDFPLGLVALEPQPAPIERYGGDWRRPVARIP
jgi:hypothetical protein